MKIILDIESVRQPLTGIGRYTMNLAQGLRSTVDVEELKLFNNSGLLEKLDSVDEPTNGEDSLGNYIRTFIRENIPLHQLARKGHRHYRNWLFSRQSEGLSDYIYHAPNYQLMPFSGCSIVTIHDLSFIRHPEFHPKERVAYWEDEIHRVAKRASHIITDSEFQRHEILDLLDVEPERVSSVHLGVEEKFQPCTQITYEKVLEKYGLRYKEYTLVVATIEPRKNFERLLKAFERLPDAVRSSFPLAIVGAKGWLSDSTHEAIARLLEKNEAVSLGYVNEEELPSLYSSASMFLYPSLYEGFGLPVLEAMACGTAVLTSNTTSIPELAGNSCVLIDPYSTDEITEAWHALLLNQTMRDSLGKASQARARQFTWDKCVSNTMSIYSKVS